MKRLMVFFMFVWFTAASIRAQDMEDLVSKNYFAVGASGGYYAPAGDFSKDTKGNAGPGVRIDVSLGITFYKIVQLRLDLDNEGHGENKSVPGTNKTTIKSSTLSLRYYLVTGKFKPFVSAGGGLADVKVKTELASDSKSMATYLAGIGCEWDISKNVGLDLLGQYRITPSKNAKFNVTGSDVKLGYNANSIGANLGLYYRFSFGSAM